MSGLSVAVREAMRQKALAIKERLQGAGGFGLPRWGLSGKNSIVEPGHEVVLRLLPRWDIAQKYLRGGGGKVTLNPKYQDSFVYHEALEHWWDSADGSRPVREWCLKSLSSDEACPVCEAWQELRSSPAQDDKDYARRIRPQEVYLFNAVLGDVGRRQVSEQGLVDIRYLPTPGTVFLSIINIMTGGENEAFARGDISDPREGYDIKLSRPSAQGDRWKVDCAPQPSPLFAEGEKVAFQGWVGRLIDLPKMLQDETKSYDDLYRAFHGSEVSTPTGGREESVTPEGTSGKETPPVDPFDDLSVPEGGIDLPDERPSSGGSSPVRGGRGLGRERSAVTRGRR